MSNMASPDTIELRSRSMTKEEEMEENRVTQLAMDEAEEYERFSDLLTQRRYKYRTLFGLLFYSIFIILFLAWMFSARHVDAAYDLRSAMRDILLDEEFPDPQIYKNFGSIESIAELWEWLEGPLLAAISNEDVWSPTDHIYRYNRLVGAVRLRQLRVAPQPCHTASALASAAAECWPAYADTTASQAPFGGASGKVFPYTSANASGSPSEHGRLSTILFEGGGFIIDLDRSNASALLPALKQLQADRWIDKGTRVVFITVNVYNANLNMFLVSRMMVEMAAGGTVFPSFQLKSFQLNTYSTLSDYGRLAVEIIVVLFIFMLLLNEIAEILAEKGWPHKRFVRYLKKDRPWNFVDVLNLGVYAVAVALWYAYAMDSSRFNVNVETSAYVDLETKANNYLLLFNVMSANILLSFLKFLKYLQVFPHLTVLGRTIKRAGKELLAFIVFFGIVFGAFACVGHVIFGPDMFEFRDFLASMSSCFRMVVGEFDYRALWLSNRLLGPTFFILFIILVYYCLANMFVAIILNAYQGVVEEASKARKIKKRLTRFSEKIVPPSRRERVVGGFRGAWNEAVLHARGLPFCSPKGLRVPKDKTDEELVQRRFIAWIHEWVEEAPPSIQQVTKRFGVVPEYAVHLLRCWGTVQKQNAIRDAMSKAEDEDVDALVGSSPTSEVDLGKKYGKIGGGKRATARFRAAVSQVFEQATGRPLTQSPGAAPAAPDAAAAAALSADASAVLSQRLDGLEAALRRIEALLAKPPAMPPPPPPIAVPTAPA